MKESKVAGYITDALFELLKSKNLSDITTTEIIRKAGVCRSSFYRNFYLPEDVIRQYGIRMFEEINLKSPIAYKEIREHTLAVNTYFWSQRERLALIEKRGLFYLLEGPIVEHCKLQMQRLNMWGNRYTADYYAGATTHLIRAWIRNNFEETPQEISTLICDLARMDLPEKQEPISLGHT